MKNYSPYIVGYSDGECVSSAGEEFSLDWLTGEIELFFIPNLGVVFKCQEKYRVKFDPTSDIFFDSRYEIYDLPENIRPATRKEIQDVGLWNYVINKEDFSNVDEELEEYLKIGEKVLEERKKS